MYMGELRTRQRGAKTPFCNTWHCTFAALPSHDFSLRSRAHTFFIVSVHLYARDRKPLFS